jgi:Eukaryotic aspartyl protease
MFNTSNSTTYADGNGDMSLQYGSASVSGVDAYDSFYLDKNGTFGVQNMHFMLVSDQQGISPTGGIIGFARNFDFTTGLPIADLVYEKLRTQNKTTSRIFSLYYASYPNTSFYTVGGQVTGAQYYTDSIVWITVSNTFFWSA